MVGLAAASDDVADELAELPTDTALVLMWQALYAYLRGAGYTVGELKRLQRSMRL